MINFIDASSAINAWEKHPLETHPKLWVWLEQEIALKNLQTAEAVFEEIERKYSLCHAWMQERDIVVVSSMEEITQEAKRIGKSFDIVPGDPSSSGVSDADLLLIATAKKYEGRVITDEKRQDDNKRRHRKNYKIPKVCEELDIPSLSFDEFKQEAGVEG